MGMLRCFIAVSLSNDIHQRLQKVVDEMRLLIPSAPLRWTPIHNIHLTLKFLGDVSSSQLELMKDALKMEAARHKPFGMLIAGLGAFPSKQKPRVVWVGLEAPRELFSLQKGIENEMNRLGYPPEEKRFNPHLTLARVTRNGTVGECQEIFKALDTYQLEPCETGSVFSVDLYHSDLQPNGAVYSKLASYKLGRS